MVIKVKSNTYENGDITAIGGNSVVFANGDFVSKSGGFLIRTVAGGTIAGVCKMNATMESDNQTVDKIKVIYEAPKDSTLYLVTADDTLAQTDEGKYYDIVSVTQVVDQSTASATTGQLQLVKFISASEGLFKIANK